MAFLCRKVGMACPGFNLRREVIPRRLTHKWYNLHKMKLLHIFTATPSRRLKWLFLLTPKYTLLTLMLLMMRAISGSTLVSSLKELMLGTAAFYIALEATLLGDLQTRCTAVRRSK